MEPTARQREGFAESAGALGKGGEYGALFFDMTVAAQGGTTWAWRTACSAAAPRPQRGAGGRIVPYAAATNELLRQ